VKVLLVSDIESKYIWDYFDKERFKDIELIISCGDLKESYLEFLTTIKCMKYDILSPFNAERPQNFRNFCF